jgi:hypothetical protein
MECTIICHPASMFAIVRRADHGITNTEWRHGCRIKPHAIGYKIVDALAWSQHIGSLDDPSLVPSNRFISTRVVRDKWDSDRPIY